MTVTKPNAPPSAATLAPAVLAVLDDGQWHHLNGIALALLRHVTPERAIDHYLRDGGRSQGERRLARKRSMPLYYQVQHGMKGITAAALMTLRAAKRVETDMPPSERRRDMRWRLAPSATIEPVTITPSSSPPPAVTVSPASSPAPSSGPLASRPAPSSYSTERRLTRTGRLACEWCGKALTPTRSTMRYCPPTMGGDRGSACRTAAYRARKDAR